MSRLVVRNYSISLDGYATGPHQDLENPLGVGGTQLHEWIFATRTGCRMIGREGGNDGLDDAFFSKRKSGVGATIMGRNMFGPIRAPGQERVDGLVGRGASVSPRSIRTHTPPASSNQDARGTTFHFVDGGIDAALNAALEAAGGRDVLIWGGAATSRQYPSESLIDEMHLAVVPVLLGSGERLFDDLGPSTDDYRCVEHVSSPAVTHVRISRTS